MGYGFEWAFVQQSDTETLLLRRYRSLLHMAESRMSQLGIVVHDNGSLAFPHDSAVRWRGLRYEDTVKPADRG